MRTIGLDSLIRCDHCRIADLAMQPADKIFAQNPTWSTKDFRNLAASSRRLASSLQSQVRANMFGLDAKEVQTLSEAARLLLAQAEQADRAARLAKQRSDALEARRKAIERALEPTLGALTAPLDQVAFVGAVASYEIPSDGFASTRELSCAYQVALGSAAMTLAHRDGDPAALVDAAWRRFQEQRAALQAKYGQSVRRLNLGGKEYLAALTEGRLDALPKLF